MSVRNSQLFYTVTHLKTDGLITKVDFLSKLCARLWLSNGKSIIIFIVDDRYIVTVTDIKVAMQNDPRPDYIVLNAWHTITVAAQEECERGGIPLISYIAFKDILRALAAT